MIEAEKRSEKERSPLVVDATKGLRFHNHKPSSTLGSTQILKEFTNKNIYGNYNAFTTGIQ